MISKHLYTYILNTHSIADLIIDIEHLDILRIQSQLHPIPLLWPVASWLHTRGPPVWWHQQPVPRRSRSLPFKLEKYQNLSNLIKL